MIIYVDNLIGSDSNNGTAGFPLASIDAAANIASIDEETEIILIPTKTNYQISNTIILSKQIYMHSKGKTMIDVDINFYYCISSFHRYQYLNINFKTAATSYNITLNTSNKYENKFEDCRLIDKTENGSVIWYNSPLYFKNCIIQGFKGTFDSRPYSVNAGSNSCENVAFIDCRNVCYVSNSKNLLFINSPCGGYPTDPKQYIIDNTAQDGFKNIDGIMYGAFLRFKKCLLLQDGNYYSVNEEFYQNGNFVPLNITALAESLETDGFYESDLTTVCDVNGDVFAPITKFKKFKLIFSEESKIMMNGIKKVNELVIASDDIDMTLARNIDKITISTTIEGDGIIKLALSVDKGDTWLTWDSKSSAFVSLPVSICQKKDFSLFTEQEKKDWYNAADEIISNGIDCVSFNSLNFNLAKDNTTNGKLEKMRFAYAIRRTSVKDSASTSQLAWQFDANGFFREMADSEKVVDVYNSTIKVKSLISSDIIKVSVMV